MRSRRVTRWRRAFIVTGKSEPRQETFTYGPACVTFSALTLQKKLLSSRKWSLSALAAWIKDWKHNKALPVSTGNNGGNIEQMRATNRFAAGKQGQICAKSLPGCVLRRNNLSQTHVSVSEANSCRKQLKCAHKPVSGHFLEVFTLRFVFYHCVGLLTSFLHSHLMSI